MINILKDIKEYVRIEKEKLKEEITATCFKTVSCSRPVLSIVKIGNDSASNRYVKNKIMDCNEVGINTKLFDYSFGRSLFDKSVYCSIRTDYYNGEKFFDNKVEMFEGIENINFEINETIREVKTDGIIVQLPIPKEIILDDNIIEDEKDVDGFNKGSLYKPATPLGIVKYLEYCKYPFRGKNVCLIGRGEITNKPLVNMLLDKDMTVTICHSKTNENDLKEYLRMSDLIICAVGKSNFLDCSKYPNKTIIDVGINFDENGKLVGDCYNKETYNNCTPVPNGIGLTTRLSLLQNVVQAYKYQNGMENYEE